MDRLISKSTHSIRRTNRVRRAIKGNSDRARLTVHISNLHVTSQIIDDTNGRTLAHASSIGKHLKGTKTEIAAQVGQDIAVRAKKAKIDKVIFDRGKRKYHGRVKALADAARQAGLEF